jgi:hypothetical protein
MAKNIKHEQYASFEGFRIDTKRSKNDHSSIKHTMLEN